MSEGLSRRAVLSGLIAALPVGMAAHVTASVEPEVKPEDLVVLKFDSELSEEQSARIRETVRGKFAGEVLVLGGGVSLEVHRGVARVEMADK